MRFSGVIAALVLLSAALALGHKHQHIPRHTHSHFHSRENNASDNVEKRSTTCQLPDDPDLHYVPGGMNKGFAMSPDQPCKPGMYGPIACKPGKVMAQWEPGSTYTYPSSMVRPSPSSPVEVLNRLLTRSSEWRSILRGRW